jgi:integrase
VLNFESALAIAAGNSGNTLEYLRNLFLLKYPTVIAALKLLDRHYTAPRSVKGYNLVKRIHKKLGFVYYVRYMDNGQMIPSKWCTHTNISWEAERFAVENRDRLVSAYKMKKANSVFDILREYYQEDSEFMKVDKARNRIISDHQRKTYRNLMENSFIPFLEAEKVKTFAAIDSALITRYQNSLLLNKKIKPQTVNGYLYGINAVFLYLSGIGVIKDNPFNNIKSIPVSRDNIRERGCYHIDSLKGVFNKVWDDKRSYYLSLLIYATDLRNSEIERVRFRDIIVIGGFHFIDIKESKSQNGIRIVPCHEFVYKEICSLVAEKKLSPDDYIFSKTGKTLKSEHYKKAKYELGKHLNLTKEEVDEQNIDFYSGRHFWKTLMNAEELGDGIEEIFMGHSVSKDVAKTYNHLDKQGRKKLLAKTRRVFEILDEKVFKGRGSRRK